MTLNNAQDAERNKKETEAIIGKMTNGVWLASMGYTCIMLLLALAHMRYSYYQTLRNVVTFVAVITAIRLFVIGEKRAACLACVIAVVFNPLFPLHMDRGTWQIIDILAIPTVVYVSMKAMNKNAPLL